ncbi:hypothetical protein M2475_001180 [Breznakia sp. PF5-3]|uniref:hypothetical protein n=1 Tax=unclassified Breznakia TaxID=2623764 RepID=UPI002405A887|nr:MULTISPECIES: hypothetical protein [unclassified Breznakia]MDL2276231.1 hypothetical protein [Breznakia sp. OttesenSCG-928-G09]MDF9824889.1 hypothetical protein [Breznakia sp. PM6-1]MDF9835612.1 hypothetical protein [Breznakia sp. PF5-3]MDF9837972.1 hypothetical protein [Breznakia sp. PFB2-8]MDF9859961.1 hypothetical protein [Breznakia sp. PH5-24]
MEVYVIENHDGEGKFPTFPKGSKVENIIPCKQYTYWSSGVIDGYETYIPNTYIENNCLNCDYNPTELVVKAKDCVELIKVVFDWGYVKSKHGEYGWLPFGILYMK